MKVSEMKKSAKTENTKSAKPEIKKEETPKKPERRNATWWWVRKDKCVPEVALYGTFNDGKGFKLICEDDKLYQESDFVQIYGMAINPFLLEIYKKIKDKKFDPHVLNEEESLVMRLFQCKHCIVEGCGSGHSWECFKNNANITSFFASVSEEKKKSDKKKETKNGNKKGNKR